MAKKQLKSAPKAVASAKPEYSSSVDSGGNWQLWLPVLAAFLVYATGLGNEMLGLDDHASTVENPAVADFSIDKLFSNFNLGMYAPMTWLSYKIAYTFSGDKPDAGFWYHVFSVLVHTFNTWLVVRLLTRLDVQKSVFWVVALLFAIHPIQAESVSWIAGYSTPLYSMFCLLSMLYYLRYAHETQGRWTFYALSLGMFVLGCLSKSAAVCLPLLLMILDRWKNPDMPMLRRFAGYAPFFLGSLGFGLLTIYSRNVSGTIVGAESQYSALERVLLVCYSPIFYISKLLLPLQLNVYYSFDKVNGALPWYYYLAPVICGGLVFAAWRYRQTAPYLSTGLLFFLANVLFTLPFASLGTFEMCADHYNYLACIGIFLILAEGVVALKTRFPAQAGLLRGAAWVWIVLVAVLAFRQVRVWKDTITVITNAIDNGFYHRGMMYFGRAVEWGDLNQPQRAIADFTKALELDPNMRDAYRMRGSLYAQTGQIDLGVKDLEKYLTFDPNDVVTWNNMAQIYMRQNKLPQALEAFNKTIQLKPEAAISYQNRAKVYELMGDMERARADVAKAKEVAQANPVKNQPAWKK